MFLRKSLFGLVAPYCAIPRDYLSDTDTPLLCAILGFGVSTWPIGCDVPSPFSERFSLGEHAKWRCDTPPPPKGYLSDTFATPYESKANGSDTPLCNYLERVLRDMGGISRWAAKLFGDVFLGLVDALPPWWRHQHQHGGRPGGVVTYLMQKSSP